MPAENLTQPEPDEAPEPEESPETPTSLTLSSELVRSSPEYKALQRQLREEARKRGRVEADAVAARSEAESVRQAAEAQRQEALWTQLATELGEDGVAAFNEVAELSETDPVGAARKFREMASRFAQSDQAAAALAAAAVNGGAPVPAQQPSSTPPPVPEQGLSGDAPLNQPTTGTDWDGIAASSSARYAEIVARNQDPITRARVTDRERGEGFMAWLGAAYIKGMKQVGRLPNR
jgi:hypothetical protein